MDEQNWSYSTTDEIAKSPEITTGQKLGRFGIAAAKGTLGFPGALLDIPVGLGNLAYETVTGKPSEVPSNIVSSTLGIPSPTSVRQLFEQIAEKKATPETRQALFGPATGFRGLAESATENIPAFLFGGEVKTLGQAANAALKGTAATAAQKGIEQFRPITGRFGPLLENIGFMTAATALHPGLRTKNLKEKIAPAYQAFEEKAPGQTLGVEKTKEAMASIDKKLRPTFEDVKPMRDKLNQIQQAYTNIRGKADQLTFSDARNLIQDLNEFSDKLTPTGQHYISEIKKSIEADMHKASPELYKDFTNARDLYKAVKKYEDASRFVQSDTLVNKALSKIGVGKLMSISPIGFGRLLKESSLARQYYTDLMKSAAKQNAAGVATSMNKLNKLIDKNPELTSEASTNQQDSQGEWSYESV